MSAEERSRREIGRMILTLELDKEHREKLAILSMLSKQTVTEYIQTYINSEWKWISESVDNSLTLDDFREMAALLHTELFAE